MNGRERLFFKDVKLHKSMSYIKKEDKENVDKMRKKYTREYLERVEKKQKLLEKHRSILYRIINFFAY